MSVSAILRAKLIRRRVSVTMQVVVDCLLQRGEMTYVGRYRGTTSRPKNIFILLTINSISISYLCICTVRSWVRAVIYSMRLPGTFAVSVARFPAFSFFFSKCDFLLPREGLHAHLLRLSVTIHVTLKLRERSFPE